jgi:glycosyltransferase involved in cell wall biosynthesis
MIARHCCIRVQKMAIPLLQRGYDVHCITHRFPMFGEEYKSVMQYTHMDQLYESIKLHKDADIFHAHNEPSWFVTAVKNVVGDKPVILDAHDSILIRVRKTDKVQTRISVDERNNFQLADGIVFVSEPMAKLCRKEFRLEQPYISLPSYVPKQWHRLDSWEWLGGITYEGRIDLPDELDTGKEMPFFRYCDFTELAARLHEKGIPLFLYTPGKNQELLKHYQNTAIWKGSYPFDKLIRKLGRHNWGFHGNINKFMVNDYAMPNKLFEYLAAGLPVIEMNAPLAGRFVEKHGLGIHVKSVDELIERWGEHRDCRKQVALKRLDWCMDNHIHKLEELYKNFL